MRCIKSGIGNAILRKNTTNFLHSNKSIEEQKNVARPQIIRSVPAKPGRV